MVAEILIQSGIYWFMAIGLWINLRVVRYADLAVENTMIVAGMTACAIAAAGFKGANAVVLALFFSVAASLILAAFAWCCWKGLRVHAIIVSLSISYILYSVTLDAFGAMKDGTGLPKLRSDPSGIALVYSAILFVSLALHAGRHSPPGRRLLAAVGNPSLAKSLGLRPGLWQWLGLSIGTGLIMASGVLHASYYTYVNIGDAVGFLLLAIFSSVLVANGLSPRVSGFSNGIAALVAGLIFQSVVTVAIYAGLPINLNKGLMGALLIVSVAVLRFRRVSQPITLG